MKNGKLYTVESGSYSDHSILAVFDDKETAELWRSALAGDPESWHTDAYLGEIDLVPKGTRPRKVTTYRQHVELWDDGRTETVGVQSSSDYPIAGNGFPPKRPRVRYVRAPCHHGLGGRLEVEGASEKAVLKTVSERIAMWKAGAWAGPGHSEINEE